MTSKKELEAMVTQFKVNDLQTLLNFAGQNTKGRKSDLQRKAIQLIRHNSSIPIEVKIRTMYRQILSEAQKNNYYYGTNNYDRYGYYTNTNNSNYAIPPAPAGMPSYNSYETKNYCQNQNGNSSYYEECMRKNNHLFTPIVHNTNHESSSSSSSPLFDYMAFLEPNTSIPEARTLRNFKFKKLSFYRYDQTIVPLMPMKPQHKFSDVFDYTHSFTVSDQAHNLLSWPKKNEGESRFQLQLRICVLDEDSMRNPSEIADSLPLALIVKVNEKSCQLPPAIPSTNKQGMLLKRMNAPINITCQSSKRSQLNTLAVNWSIECNKLYGFTVHLVEKYTSDELIDLLKTKQRGPELTRKYIHEQLDEDDDIAATTLKVSLICPLGKTLMSLPARATTCNHLQCFDAALYLKMNEVKSVWQCPICNSSCFYEDLFIDEYFIDILKSELISSIVSEVHINSDGTWEPVLVKKRKNSDVDSGDKKKKKVDEKILEISDERVKEGSGNNCTQDRSNGVNNVLRLLKNTQAGLEENGNKSNGVTLISISTPKESEKNSVSNPARYTPPSVSSTLRFSESDSNFENYGRTPSNACENNDPSKMNVMLVDLTSDSESDGSSSPLNLKKGSVDDPEPAGPSATAPAPPIYDIDDADDSIKWMF